MKTLLLLIGKTDEAWLLDGIAHYEQRIRKYFPFALKVIPDIRNRKTLSEDEQKRQESQLILQQLQAGDELVLLDESGRQMRSREFAAFIEKIQMQSTRRMVFVVGGPYGFAPEITQRANYKLSLSPMTFPHQLVRLIFLEQLYRACTIMRNEPYHHD